MFQRVHSSHLLRGAALVVAFVGSAASARAKDWYVDAAYSSCSSSDGSQGKPYCTIKAAIAAAANGDTIWIAPGVYGENNSTGKDLTLIGTQGAAVTILDGANRRRLLTLATGADVSLVGLTLQDGKNTTATPVCGGCYIDDGATLTITDCVLTGNFSAIVFSPWKKSPAALTMSRCLVTANVSGEDGVGINADNSLATLAISDSRFESNVAKWGGAIKAGFGAVTTIERCTFASNYAGGFQFAPGLGGALMGDSFTVVDCLFEDNVAAANSFVGAGGNGGAAYVWGTSRFERCRFRGNEADSTSGQSVGGAFVLGTTASIPAVVTFVDCELVGNVCGGAASGTGGWGGGVYVDTLSTARFERCTVAGNRADGTGTVTSGGIGGGIYSTNPSPAVSLSHTIVAGNSAADPAGGPDLQAATLTLDWNDVGDTTGATFTGSGPNDLLDVDPLFVDPALGDWTLQSISPAVESGDPSIPPGGKDVAQTSRVLDGDLDRVMRIDRGAHEFSHVRLAVSGAFTPGGTITVDVTGSAGLPVLLVSGVGESEFLLKPLGSLFVDLSLSVVILPWGVVPSSTPVSIDPALAVPLDVFVQALATSGRAGNLSNLVAFTIE
jgi:hypothetical protein